jgi:hypothetical protein
MAGLMAAGKGRRRAAEGPLLPQGRGSLSSPAAALELPKAVVFQFFLRRSFLALQSRDLIAIIIRII